MISASASGPATAVAGTQLTVTIHLSSLDGNPHAFESGRTSLTIVRDGRVVGQYEGGYADDATVATVSAGHVATTTVSGLLSGCPRGTVDPAAPDLTRQPLPPGAYQVVVVLPDVSRKPYGSLVTTPMPVQVTADPTALPSCGKVPVSLEPPQSRVAAVLQAPAQAKPGSTVRTQVQLRSNRGRPEQLDTGLPYEVLVVRNGSVVGRSDGPIAGVGLTITVPASGTTPMIDPAGGDPDHFGDVTLSGCPLPYKQDPNVASPSPRKPLPPGTYQLVAALDDRVGDKSGLLVAQPSTIEVR